MSVEVIVMTVRTVIMTEGYTTQGSGINHGLRALIMKQTIILTGTSCYATQNALISENMKTYLGSTGIEKSYLATALGHQACTLGLRYIMQIG